MTKIIVTAIFLSLSTIAVADEQNPPGIPYNLVDEQIIYFGLPGDPDFYEVHVRQDGYEYYVDAEGIIYRNKEEMLAGHAAVDNAG